MTKPPAWRLVLRTLPRVVILATAIVQMVRGDVFYGAFCMLALAITLVPAIYARSADARVPLALELALLALMIMDMTLGNTLGLYRQWAWFDKAMHVSSAALLGVIAFLAIYVLHLMARTRFHPWLDGVAILLVTLGLGALWEITEYGVDRVLDRRTQSAPSMAAIDDTMLDLALDAAGGVIGAVFGAAYIRRSRRSRRRVEEFARSAAHRECVPA